MSPPSPPLADPSGADTESFELDSAGLDLARAPETPAPALDAALRFLDDAAAAPRGLVRLPSGADVDGPDLLTPALALAWLPTLPTETRRLFLGSLLDAGDRPATVFAESPAPLETHAAIALAQWHSERRPAALQRAALRLLAVAQDWEHRGQLETRHLPWLLQPVLLAARLAGLRLHRPVFLRVGRMPRRVRPDESVRRYLTRLGDALMRPGAEAKAAGPAPECTLCLATELWRTTTPWSAAIRAPLEVTLWERRRCLGA
ncbi:MAG: hypothetical protein AAFX50_23270, partial [Acidobacteriota bacterium]